MAPLRIAVIIGSLRKDSINRKLANALYRLAPLEQISFYEVKIDDLPLYNQDDDGHPAASVQRLKKEIGEALGLMFVTPEYNRSIPGVLKNALDHASRPYGQNAWAGKPAGIIGCSPGAPGTAMAQQHLRNILSYLDVPMFGQPEGFIQMREGLFDETGAIGEKSRPFLQKWMDRFVLFVKENAKGPAA